MTTPRKLAFGLRGHTVALTEPEPLDLWVPQGREAPAQTYVLPIKSFKRAAVKFGHPPDIGAFAVYGGWWVQDAMYFRCDRYAELALHEWRHIETRSNFHEGESHA